MIVSIVGWLYRLIRRIENPGWDVEWSQPFENEGA